MAIKTIKNQTAIGIEVSPIYSSSLKVDDIILHYASGQNIPYVFLNSEELHALWMVDATP